MLTVNQRGILVILYFLIGIVIFFFQVEKKKSFNRRCFTFISYMLIGFPIIDLAMVPSQLNIKIFEVSTFSFFILNFRSFILKKELRTNRNIFFFFSILLLTGITSFFILNSFYEILKLSSYFLLFIIISRAAMVNREIYSIIFISMAFYAIMFIILQIIFGINFSLYGSLNENSLISARFTSFSQDPQKMAQIAYMLAIIFLGNYFLKNLNTSNIVFLLLFVAMAIIGLLTGSRAALAGFALSTIILVFHKTSIRSIALIFFLFLSFLFFRDEILNITVFERILGIREALEGRSEIFWIETLKIFYKYPITGVGYGNFAIYVSNFANDLTYSNGTIIDQPESGYIMWLIETGVIGIIVYSYIILNILFYKNKVIDVLHYKLAFVVWMVGFVSVYSFSDAKVAFLLVSLASVIMSDKYMNNRQIKLVIKK